MQAKHIGEYLASDSGTGRLVPQVAVLLAIRQRLSSALPDNLRRSCAIANYKQGNVVVFAGNSAVAAKVRLLAPKLIESLSGYGLQFTGIKVQVQAESSFALPMTEKKARSLSIGASASLARLGKTLPESRLRRAVEALAKRRS